MLEQLEKRMEEVARKVFMQMIGAAGANAIQSNDTAAIASTVKERDLHAEITTTLHDLGIRPSLLGYQYVREAIEMVCNDRKVLRGITKSMYPNIAAKYETTPSRVERGIRHAIETAWVRRGSDAMDRMFGTVTTVDMQKPTNTEFIAMVADHLMIERRTQ